MRKPVQLGRPRGFSGRTVGAALLLSRADCQIPSAPRGALDVGSPLLLHRQGILQQVQAAIYRLQATLRVGLLANTSDCSGGTGGLSASTKMCSWDPAVRITA